ncbi:RCC1 repeat-containing protein [Gammaproteobacteria bacterium]
MKTSSHFPIWLLGLLISIFSLSAAFAATPQVGAGSEHSLALASDGTLVAWGNDAAGQLGSGRALTLNTPQALPSLALGANPRPGSLAAGLYHGLATTQDGRLWTWGHNGNGQLGDGTTSGRSNPAPVKGLDGLMAMSGGAAHSLAVTQDGKVWAWGFNGYGQLGNGSFDEAPHLVPSIITGLEGVVAVASGDLHSLALKSDGSLWAWGSNAQGEMGNGKTDDQGTPTAVPGLPPIQAMAGGAGYSLALARNGTVWAWGSDVYGQLGNHHACGISPDGDEGQSCLSPRQITGLEGVVAVAAGNSHSLALKQDGTLWAWGDNTFGQLGDGTTMNRETPVPVAGLPAIRAVSAGFGHSLALDRDGKVWAWGSNGYGQLGNDTTDDTAHPKPVQVASLNGVVALAAGAQSSLILTQEGALWAWGDNDAGQLGLASATHRAIPGVMDLVSVTQLAAGWEHNLALASKGAVWAWGRNGYGQLGDGTNTNRSRPVRVAGLAPATAVAAGESFSLAIVAEQVWAWGRNDSGQLGWGSADNYVQATPTLVPGLMGIRAVAAGYNHSLALARNGTVWAWGNNFNGQLGNHYACGSDHDETYGDYGLPCLSPVQVAGLGGVVAVAAGQFHSLALKSDGSLWAWGYNGDGQLGDGTQIQRSGPVRVMGIDSIRRITAGVGANQSLAITWDGRAWSWGSNVFGQLGTGRGDNQPHPTPQPIPGLTAVSDLSAGWKFSLAVGSDGTVWAWGNNSSGELGDGTFATHARPLLAENATLDGVLDLDPSTPNHIPANAMPLFMVKTHKEGNLAALNLSIDVFGPLGEPLIRGMAASPAVYNVYVGGLWPESAGADFTWHQMNPSYQWLSFFGWPMLEFLYNAGLTTQYDSTRLDILKNADLTEAVGGQIWVGYGTDSIEMRDSGRFRKILDVTSDLVSVTSYTLTVRTSGKGSITAQAGITCGSDCSEVYPQGTQVTLTAIPSGGQIFTGWSGACSGSGNCMVTMTGDQTVTASFASSPADSVVTLITHYYQNILGRAPEPAGLAYYQDRINQARAQGRDVKPEFKLMAYNFLNSPEWLNRNTSDAVYVTTLYKTFLQRSPESAGLDYYVNLLKNGATRNNLLDNFVNSPEFAKFMMGMGF